MFLATYTWRTNVEKEIPRIFLTFGRIILAIENLKKGTWDFRNLQKK
jgi:hypothetical protein